MILPSYVGSVMNHYKDPYLTTSIIFFVTQLVKLESLPYVAKKLVESGSFSGW